MRTTGTSPAGGIAPGATAAVLVVEPTVMSMPSAGVYTTPHSGSANRQTLAPETETICAH